jgi:hypothetical protein
MQLRYPLVGELAGPIEMKSLVYILHHFLVIEAKNTVVSPSSFGSGFTRLAVVTATTRQESQSIQAKGKDEKAKGKSSYLGVVS